MRVQCIPRYPLLVQAVFQLEYLRHMVSLISLHLRLDVGLRQEHMCCTSVLSAGGCNICIPNAAIANGGYEHVIGNSKKKFLQCLHCTVCRVFFRCHVLGRCLGFGLLLGLVR